MVVLHRWNLNLDSSQMFSPPDHPTTTGDMNVQPRVERAQTDPKAIDHEFLQRCTTGFEDYRSLVEQTGWPEIMHQSGVVRENDPRTGRILSGRRPHGGGLVSGIDPAGIRR